MMSSMPSSEVVGSKQVPDPSETKGPEGTRPQLLTLAVVMAVSGVVSGALTQIGGAWGILVLPGLMFGLAFACVRFWGAPVPSAIFCASSTLAYLASFQIPLEISEIGPQGLVQGGFGAFLLAVTFLLTSSAAVRWRMIGLTTATGAATGAIFYAVIETKGLTAPTTAQLVVAFVIWQISVALVLSTWGQSARPLDPEETQERLKAGLQSSLVQVIALVAAIVTIFGFFSSSGGS